MSTQIRAPKGLQGVSVADTKIAKSESDGTLIYRGYPIKELAEHASFEEAAYLIIHGMLPTESQLKEFTSVLKTKMKVD